MFRPEIESRPVELDEAGGLGGPERHGRDAPGAADVNSCQRRHNRRRNPLRPCWGRN